MPAVNVQFHSVGPTNNLKINMFDFINESSTEFNEDVYIGYVNNGEIVKLWPKGDSINIDIPVTTGPK